MKEETQKYQQGYYIKQLKYWLNNIYHTNDNHNVKQDTTKIIEQIKLVEEFSLDQKRVLGLFSNPEFVVKYISQNIEHHLGYPTEEIYKGGLTFAFKLAYWKQFTLPLKMFQWGSRFKTLANSKKRTNLVVYFCGMKFKSKSGELKTFFIKQKILSFDDKNEPLLSFLEVEDISNVFKKDMVWARFTAEVGQESIVRAFFTQGHRKEYTDVLSEREMEILRLVAQHKTSAEIGELLNITKHTVEKHRKNMIARTGVIDMTALIYICRLCQLL